MYNIYTRLLKMMEWVISKMIKKIVHIILKDIKESTIIFWKMVCKNCMIIMIR